MVRRGALLALAMSGSVLAAPAAGSPVQGDWGGDQVRLVVTAAGGKLETSCAFGQWAGALQWQDGGRFAAAGSYEEQSGGSQRADAPAPPSVRFEAELQGDALRLRVLSALGGSPREFTLRPGQRVKLLRCL